MALLSSVDVSFQAAWLARDVGMNSCVWDISVVPVSQH